MIPSKKIKAFFILCTLFLVTAFTISPNLAVDTNNDAIDNEKIASLQQSSLVFNVSSSETIVYTVDHILNNGTDYLNISNHDPNTNTDTYIGKIVQGTNIGFNFNYADNNGTMDYVVGNLRGPDLQQEAHIEYWFVDPSSILTAKQGPPMAYFVIPQTNFTEAELNLTSAGFTVNQTNDYFRVTQSYYTTTGAFNKISSSPAANNANVTVKWNKHTGIMEYYFYNYTGSNPATLEFTFQGVTNPGDLNPGFSYKDPEMFYEISTLMVGTSSKLDFDSLNDNQSYGFMEQGQYADISLHTGIDNTSQNGGGPYYEGQLRTMTGLAPISNPFSNVSKNDGPQGLFFLMPVSSDAGWWTNLSLWLTLDGYYLTAENTTHITFQRHLSTNTADLLTVIFNKVDGVLTYYNFETTNVVQLPGTNTTGVFNLELQFKSLHDFYNIQPSFLVTEGQQFKYHLDVLDFNGNTTTDNDGVGYFQQGQDIHILIDYLNLTDGPMVNLTLSTITGKGSQMVNFDFFSQSDGPVLFIPLIPLDTTGQITSYFDDLFTYIISAQATNNATVLGFTATNFSFDPNVTVDRLTINWNKSTGLIINYDLEMHSITDPTQVIKLKFHYLGESTGQTIYVPPTSTTNPTGSTNSTTPSSSSNVSTISTPGFEFFVIVFSFGILVLVARKKRTF